MNLARALPLLIVAALPTVALADMTAIYAAPKAPFKMTVEVATNGDVRGDVGKPGQSYITRDGHGYFLKAGPKGMKVMRIEDMGTVMAEQMSKLDPNFRAQMGQAPVLKLVPRGSVTIGGRTGTAYFMQAQDGSLSPFPWAVISADPKLAPLDAAMEHQFEMSMTTMSSTMGTAPFANMLAVLKTGTPILFAGAELQSVSFDPVPSSHFELPAKPETIEGVRAIMMPPPAKP